MTKITHSTAHCTIRQTPVTDFDARRQPLLRKTVRNQKIMRNQNAGASIEAIGTN
jgi:hypothetical protein